MVSMEQLQAVNATLASSQQQVATLSGAIDSLRAESSNAVAELRALLAAEQQRGQARDAQLLDRRTRDVSFVNVKTFDGGQFAGGKSENFRAWAKKVKVFCNAQSKGFRKALEVAEKQETPVDIEALNLRGWDAAVDADTKFHDFLSTYTSGDAQRIVDEVPD